MSDPNQPTEELENMSEPVASGDDEQTTDEVDQSFDESNAELSEPSDTESEIENDSLVESESAETLPESNSADADPAAHDDIDLGENEEDPVEEVEQGDPYGGHNHDQLRKILESALFASGATLSVSHLRDMFESHERPHGKIVRQIMAELIAFYEGRGITVVEVASGYRFQTDSGTSEWISRLWEEKPQRYSRALMETIALIAYRQPITRGEIEDVRGVAVSSNIIRTLLEREWVRVVGHRDVPGRPAMYATTRQFLDYFGLKSLDQLPALSEIRDMDELNPQMDLEGADSDAESSEEQSEITFSGMIEKLRDGEADGKTGSQFIDDQLDDELAAMDEVNTNFEQALEQQRAEHEHPDLDLEGDSEADVDDNQLSESGSTEAAAAEPEGIEATSDVESSDASIDEISEDQTEQISNQTESSDPLSEEEQWKIIQEKLAQQQALLDARESDQPGEDENNE